MTSNDILDGMKKPMIISVSILASILLLALIIYIIPAPFKPSLWNDLMKHNTQSQLDKSSDPVYLPHTDRTAYAGGMTYHSRFTMYSTWKDAYYIQSIYQGYYYQLSPRSVINEDSIGPDMAIIYFLRDIKDGKVCHVVDLQITDCSFGDQRYGADRKFKVYGKDGYTFVAEVTQINYSQGKETIRSFNDEEVKQIELMLKDTSPTPLSEARKSRFEYNI